MPPRRIKAERVARQSAPRRPPPEDEVEMEVPDNEEDDEAAKLERVLASIANYPDQPLEAIQQDKIRVLGSDIRVHDQLFSQSMEAMSDTAVMLADTIPNGEDPFENEEILKIKASLLELMDLQHISALHLEALDDDVRKPIGSGREMTDPASIFNAGLEQRTDSYRSQSARQKYGKSKIFKKFIEEIWEVGHSEAMPPATQFLPREDGDPEESDDDLEVGGVTQDYKCPITMQIYVDPLTSTVCGHTFSSEGIREYLKTNDKCPGTGCNARISLAVLKLDKTIQKKAIAAQRRADKNAEDDDPTDSDIDVD